MRPLAWDPAASFPPSFPPVEQLLPHGPPMRLIESIVEELPDGLVCKVVVGENFIFLRNGEAEGAVCVELVAQTIACCAALADVRRGDKPRPGLLVGCRKASFDGEPLRVRDELLVTVRRQWVKEPVASFTGEVTRSGHTVASVEVCVASVPEGWSGELPS